MPFSHPPRMASMVQQLAAGFRMKHRIDTWALVLAAGEGKPAAPA